MKGIFAIDPGGSTGLAWAIVDETSPTVADAMRKRIDRGSATVTGPEIEQAREILQHWLSFKRQCVQYRLLEPDWLDLVCEDFILTPGRHKPGKEGISPVRVQWAFEGYRRSRADAWRRPYHYNEMILQPPSAAMRFNHRKLLDSWDAWVVGRPHERQAQCHVGLRIMRTLRARSTARRG